MFAQIVLLMFLLAGVLTVAHLIFGPPPLNGRTATQATRASSSTTLGRLAAAPLAGPKRQSGAMLLLHGPDALAARIALIQAAEAALDVQYYIWQRDATGLVLLNELRKAAGRGVRIRLLLDDNGIRGLDGDLAALDALPNFEVRLFNPFVLRTLKSLGYVFDFVRLNRRMHNKSLSADGAISIVGGRNIADVYFGFGTGVQFLDTDVMVAGQVVAEIGASFDRYWQSSSAHPIARIVDKPKPGTLEGLIFDSGEATHSQQGRLYAERLRESDVIKQIKTGRMTFEWTEVISVSDDPAKGLGKAKRDDLLFTRLMALLAKPSRSVDLVSAYFVPGKRFSKTLEQLARTGVRVRILTNSQAATDVVLVHSAYVKYRRSLLRSGVELYELKPEYATQGEPRVRGLAGSSRASLHSKTLAVDEERIFVGSFNFDPRSVRLNTEMGVLIDSPHMAESLAVAFAERFQRLSYVPELNGEGTTVWEELGPDGTKIRYRTEPRTSARSRLLLWLAGSLPIEWLL
ncbi:MAG TPA: phospholipase D family protein [Steroidobacteraceae bacterium]